MHQENARQDTKRRIAEAHASVLAGLAPGTILMTREGETPVEWLESGDEVLTRDRGFVPILWINRTKLNRKELRDFPEYAPVSLLKDRVEPGIPAHDMVVSPRQLILVRSSLAQKDFGSSEVLVPANAIGDQVDPTELKWDARVSYAQVLLPAHQTFIAEGLWLGSLFTGTLGLEATPDCPLTVKLEQPRMNACRPVLNEDEGRVLMQEIWQAQAAAEVMDKDFETLESREAG